MNVEIRADGLHLSGYVNVTEKMSRPVITGKGQKVIELIEPRAFEKALEKVDNVPMTKDHNPDVVLAETRAKTLELHEDAIGLHYDATITDAQTITEARAGKLKGLSFGMKNITDKIEERADALPLRRVSAFDLDHITLVVHKTPVYAATSIEMRADETESTVETRASVVWESKTETSGTFIDRTLDDGTNESERTESTKTTSKRYDNSEYKNRIAALATN
ncbi:MAG: HK97 family phage prohead protease [Prevotella sp.]